MAERKAWSEDEDGGDEADDSDEGEEGATVDDAEEEEVCEGGRSGIACRWLWKKR